jgi:hypothetical protein
MPRLYVFFINNLNFKNHEKICIKKSLFVCDSAIDRHCRIVGTNRTLPTRPTGYDEQNDDVVAG